MYACAHQVAGVDQFYQVKPMTRGIGGCCVFDLFSNFKWVRSSGYFDEPLGSVATRSGLGKQNWQ